MSFKLRDQRFVTLGQTSKQILGPNARRKSVIITAPPALTDEAVNVGAAVEAFATTATGVALSYTLPAGQQGILAGATFFETAETGVVANLQLVRATVTYNLASFTTAGYYAGAMVLQPGDTIQWNVTTDIAASTADFTLSIALDQQSQRITISFIGPAVVDQGITLAPGTLPLTLDTCQYGDSLCEPIYAIADNGTPTIGVFDIFGP